MFENLTKKQLLKKAKAAVENARNADVKFVKAAEKAFQYTDNVQWDSEKLDLMDEEDRTARTFNMIRRRVDLVLGVSEDDRVRYFPAPVETNDGFLCEILGTAADWMIDKYKVDDVHYEAKDATTICGRGWEAVDFSLDPKRLGHIKLDISNVSVYDVKKDPASRDKKVEKDGSYLFWDRWLTLEDFKMKFPKYAKHAEMVMTTDMMLDQPIDIPGTDDSLYSEVTDDLGGPSLMDYNTPLDMHYYDKSKRRIRFVHLEYWQTFKRYYREDQETGKLIEFDDKHRKQLEQIYTDVYNIPFDYFHTIDKKVKWLQFLGDKILYDDDAPVDFNGFSLVLTMGGRDASLKTPLNYGIVKDLIDPSDEVNERWSQMSDWVAKSVQTGIYYEPGAFVDEKTGLDSLTQKGSATALGVDGIAKIKDREMPKMPTAPIQMEQMAQDLFDKISGINPDLMGADRGRQDSGVVVSIRREQGIKLLVSLFKNFKSSQQAIYERILAIITQWMPEDQLASILGEQGEKYHIRDGVVYDLQHGFQANYKDLKNLQYNIKFEQRPGNKTLEMLELATFLEMQQYGVVVDPDVLIERTTLTATQKEQWKKYIKEQKEAEKEAADQQFQLEMAKIQAGQQSVGAKIQSTEGMGMAKLAEAKRKGDMKHYVDVENLDIKERGQELDFIARTEQTKAAKEQQRNKASEKSA